MQTEGCSKESNIVREINNNEKLLIELGKSIDELKIRLETVSLNTGSKEPETKASQPDRERCVIDRKITEIGYQIKDLIDIVRGITEKLQI